MEKLMVVPWLSSLLITGKSTTQFFASVNGPSMSKFCKEQPPVVIKITTTQSNFNPQSQFHSPKWVCQWCRPIHLSHCNGKYDDELMNQQIWCYLFGGVPNGGLPQIIQMMDDHDLVLKSMWLGAPPWLQKPPKSPNWVRAPPRVQLVRSLVACKGHRTVRIGKKLYVSVYFIHIHNFPKIIRKAKPSEIVINYDKSADAC